MPLNNKSIYLLLYSWQDLLVGAPQYFEKGQDYGGAVYVYINDNGNWNNAVRTRINGPKNSMFGLAIENLGDLNLDGFNGELELNLQVEYLCLLIVIFIKG